MRSPLEKMCISRPYIRYQNPLGWGLGFCIIIPNSILEREKKKKAKQNSIKPTKKLKESYNEPPLTS